MTTYAQKRILIIFTGGTVTGNVASDTALQNIKSRPDSFIGVLDNALEIVKANWGIEAHPETVELFDIDSSNMLPANWTTIAATIEKRYDEFDAFIVLHGTNTMGYTSSALSFAFENINKPVIITGAQVPLGYLGSDATTNLVNSLRVAIWGYHPIKGVLAVFGSKIITGVRVKKGTDFDYDPFRSFQSGALGQIGRFIKIDSSALDKHISYLSKYRPLAIQSKVLSVKKDFDTAAIASLTEFPGMPPNTFKVLVESAGVKAFIFRAFGAGDASAHLFPALTYLREREIPVVVTSQAPSGVASFQVNETGQYIREHDLGIPAYDMSIESMTTKLGWLMAQKFKYHDIKAKMIEDMRGEIRVESELV